MVGFAIFVFLFVFNCAYGFEMMLRGGQLISEVSSESTCPLYSK